MIFSPMKIRFKPIAVTTGYDKVGGISKLWKGVIY